MSYVGTFVSVKNSYNSALAANATWQGESEDVTSFNEIDVNVAGLPINAPGTMVFEFSPDGIHWDVAHEVDLQTLPMCPMPLRVVLPRFRVRYINGSTALTELRVTVVYHRGGAKHITRFLDQSVDPYEPIEVVRSVISGQLPDGSFGHIQVAADGKIAIGLPAGASTESTLLALKSVVDALLTELAAKTEPVDQQHVLIDNSTVAVTGPLTDSQLRATPLPLPTGASTESTLSSLKTVADSILVELGQKTEPADTQAVSVLNFPATQAVTGPLTDTQLRALPVPVSGPLTDTQLRATPVIVGLRDDVHGKAPQWSAFGILKTAPESIVADYRFDAASVTDDFTVVTTGLASYTIESAGTGLKMSTGAAVGKVTLTAKQNTTYQSGRGLIVKQSIITGDSGIVGNIREWGRADAQNGTFLRLNGTALSWVIRRNGVETSISSSSWDIPVVHDGNGHLWYQQLEWLGVGNIYLYYDEAIVHTYRFIGTSTEFSIGTPDLPVWLRNENVSNTTNVYLKTGCIAVAMEGGDYTIRIGNAPTALDNAALTKSVITGKTTAGGGSYVDVKVSPSGAVQVAGLVDQGAAGASPWLVTGPLTDAELRAAAVAVSAAALPLPAGASTEATLAAIKAKTDNIDVALSTRTKPADQQETIEPYLQQRYDLSSSTVNYIGYAARGTASGDALWKIKRLDFDVNGNLTQVRWSNTTAVWDNRTSETYT